jgi:hypothetical protein
MPGSSQSGAIDRIDCVLEKLGMRNFESHRCEIIFMIVGFSRHGKGRAQGAINYLLSEHGSGNALDYLLGEKNRVGVRRTPLPVVVRGNPAVTQRLINSVPFEWRYTSAALSFSAGERITPEMEQKIISAFESVAFAGLEPDQYNILWIRHAHMGREELHFLAPRIELRSGKSLNIAPPGKGSRLLFDTFRSKINAEYGLSDPDDPARRRGLSLPAHIAKLKDRPGKNRAAYSADVREAITRLIAAKARDGKINGREDVIRELKAAGFGIHRQGKKYLTVVHPLNKEHFRLHGAWYEQQLAVNPLRSISHHVKPNHTRVAVLKLELERLRLARAKHHLKRYGTAPINLRPLYDRIGLSTFGSRQTARIAIPTARTEIDPLHRRFDKATQQWSRACRNFDLASQRFSQTHRIFANDFERKIAMCKRRRKTISLLQKYGVRTGELAAISNPQLEDELEMEMESG